MILTREVSVKPAFLSADLDEHILHRLRGEMEGTCSKEDGYILEVIRLVAIVGNYISSANSDVVMKVEVETKMLCPDLDSVYEGVIDSIIPHGVFVKIGGKMKVLAPFGTMTGFSFNEETQKYQNEQGDVIQLGDVVRVVITNFKYSNQDFKCLGKLKM